MTRKPKEVDKKTRDRGIAYHKSFSPSSDNQEFKSPSQQIYKMCKLSYFTFSRRLKCYCLSCVNLH